jgi:hypothetical protein
MNGRTSRRTFVALATGALASLAAGLGRVFGQSPTGRPDPQLDAPARDPLAEGATVTAYTCDDMARLLCVTELTNATAATFAYPDA